MVYFNFWICIWLIWWIKRQSFIPENVGWMVMHGVKLWFIATFVFAYIYRLIAIWYEIMLACCNTCSPIRGLYELYFKHGASFLMSASLFNALIMFWMHFEWNNMFLLCDILKWTIYWCSNQLTNKQGKQKQQLSSHSKICSFSLKVKKVPRILLKNKNKN